MSSVILNKSRIRLLQYQTIMVEKAITGDSELHNIDVNRELGCNKKMEIEETEVVNSDLKDLIQ